MAHERSQGGDPTGADERSAPRLEPALGAVEESYAVIAAIERLTELRAAGLVSEENFVREKRCLLGLQPPSPM